MSTRNRSLRKLSGITPDSPEFDILVKRSQLYREMVGEMTTLVTELRRTKMQLARMATDLRNARNTLFQLKLAALGAITQDAATQVNREGDRITEEAFQEAVEKSSIGFKQPETGPA